MTLFKALFPKRMGSARMIFTMLILITMSLMSLQIIHLYSNEDFAPIETLSSDEANQPGELEDATKAIESAIGTSLEVENRPDSRILYSHHKEQFELTDYHFDANADQEYKGLPNLDQLLKTGDEFKSFLNDKILKAIKDSTPGTPPINNKAHYNKQNKYEKSWDYKLPVTNGKLRENNIVDPIRTKEFLSSFLRISDEEKTALKNSHGQFIREMPDSFPEGVKVKGDGILYAGGGQYNWLVLLSLKMLRDRGSKLPVEIFIPTESEYSVELCDTVFPLLGAKCIVMSSYLDKNLKIKLRGYQLKSMALMLTSFENVLLLDSDNLPVNNPDYLFVNEPFKSKGMVVWPDFWRRSTSPTYYEIVGIKVNETNQVRFSYNDERDHPINTDTLEAFNTNISYHDLQGTFPEASSESGQLMINRKTHAKAIFLSLYYNFHGPSYYYGLLAQGQAGEGDKETYLAAAHELGLPYYQVQEFIREFGRVRDDGGIDIAAMGQYDPVVDYYQSLEYDKFKSNFSYSAEKDNYLFHRFNESNTMFLHCNQPKLYPWKAGNKGLQDLLSADGGRRRLYSHHLINELGIDYELEMMRVLEWVLCGHGDLEINGLRDPGGYCEKVKQQIEFLVTGVDETKINEEKADDKKSEDEKKGEKDNKAK